MSRTPTRCGSRNPGLRGWKCSPSRPTARWNRPRSPRYWSKMARSRSSSIKAPAVPIRTTGKHRASSWTCGRVRSSTNGRTAVRRLAGSPALDERRGFFFAGCLEGTVFVLDTRHGGRILSSLARGSGFDVVGYDATLGHLYMAGQSCVCLVVLGVSSAGRLSFLGRSRAPSSTHCTVADDRGHAWVCDPNGGRLCRVDDSFPASL